MGKKMFEGAVAEMGAVLEQVPPPVPADPSEHEQGGFRRVPTETGIHQLSSDDRVFFDSPQVKQAFRRPSLIEQQVKIVHEDPSPKVKRLPNADSYQVAQAISGPPLTPVQAPRKYPNAFS